MRVACFCGAMFTSEGDCDVCPCCRTPVAVDGGEDRWVEALRSDLDEWGAQEVWEDRE